MKASIVFTLVGLASVAAGTGFYLTTQPAPRVAPADIGAAALYAATFRDLEGQPVSLGRFAGHPLVINFWATWCAPCREEMPALSRVSSRVAPGVQFVGLAQDDPAKVRQFAHDLGVTYPLWIGADDVMELSRRLGNRTAVLPFTVVLDGAGRVIAQKVGAYKEDELARVIDSFSR